GVKPRRPDIVGHLDICAEIAQRIKCPRFSDSRVARRQDANWHTATTRLSQHIKKAPDAAPDNEGADEVHAIGGLQLECQFSSQIRLVWRVHEECILRKWRFWSSGAASW